MTRRFLHIIMFLFAACTGSASVVATVPFQMENGLIIVEAEVDGDMGLFVFDTGASDLILDRKSVASSVGFQTMHGIVGSAEISVDHVLLGDYKRTALRAYEMDLSSIDELTTVDISGILGSSFFEGHTVSVDYLNYTISLFADTHNSMASGVEYELLEGVPTVTVTIGGHDYSFILDTGATCHFIDKSLASDLSSGLLIGGAEVEVTTAFGKTILESKILTHMELGSEVLADQKVVLTDMHSLVDSRTISGLLSVRALSDVGIHLDTRQQKIFIQ